MNGNKSFKLYKNILVCTCNSILFDDIIDAHLMNAKVVATMLFLWGLVIILIEKRNIFPFLLLPTFPKIERSETDIPLLGHQLKLNAARPIILRHIPI